ncbi:hypothetical protein [Sphingopyxis sp. C-1]|jgi:hypothetical protein|uniref:DUF6941 family protein n=1 Tax=Sphingopyxis sp. C-1 TaxID=262667 RepID=UPI0007855B0A|nr:hypothetical protein [Sphingopyxis sp. C-1]
MIINPRLPTGHVVFCDDIREELGGKLTYVGVYRNALVISAAAPVTLPQLCAAVSLRIEPPTESLAITLRISRSDSDEALFEAQVELEALVAPPPSPFSDANSVPFFELFFPVRMQSLVIERDCAIKVRAHIGDDEIRLGAILVSFAEMAHEDTPTLAD